MSSSIGYVFGIYIPKKSRYNEAMSEIGELTMPNIERTTTTDNGNEKVRISEIRIPLETQRDLAMGVNRYLGIVRHKHPQVVVPLLRSGGLAHIAAEGLAERTDLLLYDPQKPDTTHNPDATLIARANIGREISGRISVELDLLPPEFLNAEAREAYFHALEEDEPVTELVGQLAEVLGQKREVMKAKGQARVEIVDDWAYEMFAQGLTAPWVVLEALRRAGAVDIRDTTLALAGNDLLAARSGLYGMADIEVPGVTLGRSILLENGAWIDNIRDANVPQVQYLPEPDRNLPHGLLKDLIKGGFEDENDRLIPFSTTNWEAVLARGAAMLANDNRAQRKGSKNPADVLDKCYNRADLLQLHARTAAALHATL